MHRRTALAALSGTAALGLAGCLGDALSTSPPCSDDPCDVGMSGDAFLPAEYTVSVGETVRWRNTSARRHTVTARTNGLPDEADYFASGGYADEETALEGWRSGYGGNVDSGETYEHTFSVPGTYQYYCIPHEAAGMDGRIVVEE